MPPPSADTPEPKAQPPCSVRFPSVSDAPAATSNRRKADAARAMVSPLPRMVRLSFAAMTGRPVAPSVVLSTAVNEKVLPGTSVIAFDPPARVGRVDVRDQVRDGSRGVIGWQAPIFQLFQGQ